MFSISPQHGHAHVCVHVFSLSIYFYFAYLVGVCFNICKGMNQRFLRGRLHSCALHWPGFEVGLVLFLISCLHFVWLAFAHDMVKLYACCRIPKKNVVRLKPKGTQTGEAEMFK